MTPEQIELLLSLTRHANSDGDELISETQRKYQAHVANVMRLRAMWREAGERLDREEQRFGHYFPKEERREAIPRAVAAAKQLAKVADNT